MKRAIVFLIFLILGTSLTAEENTEKKWVIEVTPYFGAPELDGDITLKGRTGSVNMSFGDIWDTLDFAFMGRVEAWQERWGFFLDGTYMKQGANFKTKRSLVSADLDLNIARLEFGAGYRLWETQVRNGRQRLSFDLLGGGRYMAWDAEIEIKTGGPLADLVSESKYSKENDWVDPIVGGRVKWDVDEKLALFVRGDLGGFDIGAGSHLTWNLLMGVDYKISEKTDLKAGYHIFDVDYENGSGDQKSGMDVQFRGPIIGLTMIL